VQVIDLLKTSDQQSLGRHTWNSQAFASHQLKISQVPGLIIEHTCIRLESLDDAEAAIAYSRRRSANWGACKQHDGPLAALPNVAHAFTRLLVHNLQKGWIATVHMVDLAGATLHAMRGLFAGTPCAGLPSWMEELSMQSWYCLLPALFWQPATSVHHC
jgi:hypothetical protein